MTLYVASRVLNFEEYPIRLATCPAAMLMADPVMNPLKQREEKRKKNRSGKESNTGKAGGDYLPDSGCWDKFYEPARNAREMSARLQFSAGLG